MRDPSKKGKKGRVKEAVRAAGKAGRSANKFELAPAVRRHHKVLGEREKRGLSAVQGRARSEQIRRETLAVEHSQQGRTNAFVDGRFGEADEAMPMEDKLIRRFQRERQRQIRSSKFSLAEGGEPAELTHAGRSLGEMDHLADGEFGGACTTAHLRHHTQSLPRRTRAHRVAQRATTTSAAAAAATAKWTSCTRPTLAAAAARAPSRNHQLV